MAKSYDALSAGRRRGFPFARFVIGLILAVLVFFPLWTNISGSFKSTGQIFADPFGVPRPFTLDSYAGVLGRTGAFWSFFLNSAVIAAFTILITLFASILAGIALSRLRYRGRDLLFNFFVMGLLFPITVAILPLYIQLRNFGLLGTRGGVVLAEAAFSLPFAIFVLTGFFRDIPWELQDAVSIDGGGILTFAFRVALPLSAPVVTTVTIITLINSWNQFLLPLIVLDDAGSFTIPLGVMQFQGQFTTGWNMIMALITISIVPVVLFYVFLQKYIVAGLTAGAVKG